MTLRCSGTIAYRHAQRQLCHFSTFFSDAVAAAAHLGVVATDASAADPGGLLVCCMREAAAAPGAVVPCLRTRNMYGLALLVVIIFREDNVDGHAAYPVSRDIHRMAREEGILTRVVFMVEDNLTKLEARNAFAAILRSGLFNFATDAHRSRLFAALGVPAVIRDACARCARSATDVIGALVAPPLVSVDDGHLRLQ
jgi:hypothetical protein